MLPTCVGGFAEADVLLSEGESDVFWHALKSATHKKANTPFDRIWNLPGARSNDLAPIMMAGG
jgi:hypothetical protein